MFSLVNIVLKSYFLNKWSILFFDGLWVLGKGDFGNKDEVVGMLDIFLRNVFKCGMSVDEVLLLGRDGRVWDLNIIFVVLFKFRVKLMFKDFCLRFLVIGGFVVFVDVGIGMCFIGFFIVVVMVRKVLTRIVIFFIVCEKFCGSIFK